MQRRQARKASYFDDAGDEKYSTSDLGAAVHGHATGGPPLRSRA